jgi:aspartyl-tRNA(Asn)/glutamyl-tRNA(Gln) amidotransferase subunit A
MMNSALEIRDAIRSGRASTVEVCKAALTRIAAQNPSLNAFRTVDPDGALQRAAELDARRNEDAHLPLFGVPVALKDNMCTREMPTTAGSHILERYTPPYDAAVTERLEAAGAVIVGKTNCDEFAMGSSTEFSAFGPTRNPWSLDRTPGGSSGGSAAAVAGRLVPIALGSDTGGSIRQPAALCGVVGLKPTYGRVSRYGLLAFASSLDQIGPLTTTVADAAACLSVIAGHDPRDATSSTAPVEDYTATLTGDVRGLRIGVARSLFGDGLDPEVLAACDHSLEQLREAGASLVDIELPHSSHAIAVYYLVAMAEASSNLSRYDGVRYGYRAPGAASLGEMYDRTRDEGFGPEVKRRIILGTYVLSEGYYDAYYLKAQQVRTLIRQDYERAFANVDVIAMPTSPTPAFKLGDRVEDPLQMYLVDVFTVGVSLSGLPAISVPCGFTAARLPIGLQLIGRAMGEVTVLKAADALERATSHARELPPDVKPG